MPICPQQSKKKELEKRPEYSVLTMLQISRKQIIEYLGNMSQWECYYEMKQLSQYKLLKGTDSVHAFYC